jgi:hypothetical protein
MFGRWLRLLRRGPDLLRVTPLGLDPDSVEDVACDQPAQASGGLRSRDADAKLVRMEPRKEHALPIHDP